ncbi:hypothetical protein [Polyangium fumosum]|uniref:Uncharacterized protein n=1 Tax=Polyangium fumosum TaxID=889272 RepID=A0A4V5PQ28_9BACT|nr:hypothetical protein [Polyangium fumosum]TKD09913.1 hypothetical protein E8A74_09885 [Polyangium fumosum]
MPEPRLPTAYARRSDGRIYVNSFYLREGENGEAVGSWYALTRRESERFLGDLAEQKRVGLHLVGSDHRIYVPEDKVGNRQRRRVFHGAPAGDELTALLIEEIHRVASEVVSLALREVRALGRGVLPIRLLP